MADTDTDTVTRWVAADTADLADFVSRGARYVAALDRLAVELAGTHRRADLLGLPVDDLAPGQSRAMVCLDVLIGAARTTNRFVDSVRVDLLTDGIGPDDPLRPALAAGPRYLVSDIDRDRMVDAITSGTAADLSTLPDGHIPPAYLALLQIDEAITTLRADRDEADGRWFLPSDGDQDRVASIDVELDALRDRRVLVAGILGIDGPGAPSEAEAIAIVGRWTGSPRWAGRRYARLVETDRQRLTTSGGRLARSVDHPDELTAVAQQVAADPNVGVAFFNELGAEGTAALATLAGELPPSDGDEPASVVALFGQGLGAASQARTPGGSRRLHLSGAELVDAPRVAVEAGADAVHPAVLLIDGHFDPEFLAEATAATLELAEREPRAGTAAMARPINPARDHLHHGPDPRNIVLARSAQDSDAAALVVERLATGPFGLQPVLSPTTPFDDTVHPSGGNGATGSVPVTSFLVAAGADDRAANRILQAAAEPDRTLGGAGVAGGVDGVMAIHASLLYPADVLDRAGIERTTINGGAETPIGPAQWRAAHAKVLDAGQGSALAVGTELLLHQAIINATGDGVFDHAAIEPFATIAALAESEADEARRTVAARADAHARRHNRAVSLTVGSGLAALGLLPPLNLAATGASASFAILVDGASTDHERDVLHDQYHDLLYVGQDRTRAWSHLVNHQLLDHAAAGDGLEIVSPSDGQMRNVSIRRADDGHQWFDAGSDTWRPVPPYGSPEYLQMFSSTRTWTLTLQTALLADAHLAGVFAAADNPDDIITRRGQAAAQTAHRSGYGDEKVVDAAARLVEGLGVDDWLADG